MELAGKTAVVTGASSGFGAATVRKLREAGVRVAGGARRVERIDADVALPLDVTDETELHRVHRQGSRGARRDRHPLQQRRPRARPLPLLRVDAGGRGDRPAHERRRRDPGHASRASAHPRRGPHSVHGLDRGQGGVPERRRVRGREVRAARLRLRAARRPARASDPDHDRRSGPRRRPSSRSSVSRATARPPKRPTSVSSRSRADDVAECVLFAVTRPLHVNVDEMVIKALAQSSGGRILRSEA